MKPHFTHAVKALVPKANFSTSDNAIVHWDSEKPQPTEEAIQAKLKELEKQYADNKYQRDRMYPELGQQFDNLWHDINEGKLDKNGGFYKAIKAVKDAHPKPE